MPPHKARHETVHMIEEGKLQKQQPVQNLDAAPAVGMRVGQQAAPDPARPARGKQPHRAVLTTGPDAGGHACSACLAGLCQQRRLQCRQVCRYILAIAVKHANQLATRRQQRRSDGRTLAGTGLMAQHPQFGNVGGAAGKLGRAVIGAGIIDIDDLEPASCQRGADFLDKRADIAGLVHDRHKHRDLDRGGRNESSLGSGHEDTLGRDRNNGMNNGSNDGRNDGRNTCVSLPTHAARVKRIGAVEEN